MWGQQLFKEAVVYPICGKAFLKFKSLHLERKKNNKNHWKFTIIWNFENKSVNF